MAETFVQVNEGTGKKLHSVDRTVGANIVHDSVTVPGEPYRATYSVSVTGVSTGTSGGRLLSIFAGATLPVRLWYLRVSQLALAGAAARADLVIQRITALGTAGTVANITRHDNADPANAFTAESLHQGSSLTGALWRQGFTLSAAAPITAPDVELDLRGGHNKPLVIPAGTSNGLALVIVTGIATSTVNIHAIVDEGNY